MLGHEIEAPFKLGQIYTSKDLHEIYSDTSDNAKGKHIAIDADNHMAVIMVVHKMVDDERNPELEEFAERVVACLNYLDGIPTKDLIITASTDTHR